MLDSSTLRVVESFSGGVTLSGLIRAVARVVEGVVFVVVAAVVVVVNPRVCLVVS